MEVEEQPENGAKQWQRGRFRVRVEDGLGEHQRDGCYTGSGGDAQRQRRGLRHRSVCAPQFPVADPAPHDAEDHRGQRGQHETGEENLHGNVSLPDGWPTVTLPTL